MSDKKYLVLFGVLGLVLAIATSTPLWKNRKSTVNSIHGPKVYAEGQIVINPALIEKTKNAQALFLFVKAKGMKGAPMAVKRIDHPHFPLDFSLTQADSMMETEFYEGDITITARLDQDGLVGPKTPEDLELVVELSSSESRMLQLEFK